MENSEKYIQPFITVCSDVFRDMTGYVLEAGYPFFMTRDQAQDWDISGLIGLSGEAKGAVVLSMKTALAAQITGKLTGKKHNSLDNDVIDAVGELVNIIAGNVKQKLEDQFNLIISLPSIIKGPGHEIVWSGEHIRILCIPFKAPGSSKPDDQTFNLSVALSSERSS
jgi:chemotaxis protein CheX